MSEKIVHLVDRIHLFKISNLVYDGKEIVRSLYSSLQGQAVYGGYSKLAAASVVWPLVPKFAGSNPAVAVGVFRAKKSSTRLPSEGK